MWDQVAMISLHLPYGTLHFDGGEGVDKIDLSLLELDDEADSLSVVISVADGVISGGLSYEFISSFIQENQIEESTRRWWN